MQNQTLLPLDGYSAFSGPIVTVVLDGIGLGKRDESDGVFMAHTPVLDDLLRAPLATTLKAHGSAVGLPSEDDMGNSEVGHNALGAGRIFSQGAKLVSEAIKSGKIFSSSSWREIEKRCAGGATLHVIGLVSDGNVHSHIDHLYAILKQSVDSKIKKLRIHGLLDGRDVSPKSALTYFVPLEEKCKELCISGYDYRIASGGGRMNTTMDRYQADWSIVERGWKAHVLGQGRMFASATEAIQTYYDENSAMTDQYMDSFVIADAGVPVGNIIDGDAVVFFNFRGDRSIEISQAFEDKDFTQFDRQIEVDVFYAGMMQYDGDALVPKNYLVEPPSIHNTLGEYLCATNISSFAVSETQKFGHVTYFWNGNKSGYINEKFEKYAEIESDRVQFDQRPWMQAAEITDRAIEAIDAGGYKFIRINYPNGDMVGHTGVVEAVRIAVESVDLCLGRLLSAIKKKGGIALITADHGNADCMWTEKNGVRTPMVAHTKNPVPCIVKDYNNKNNFRLKNIEKKGLANVAATVCVLLGFLPPQDYEPPLVVLVE
ncbi:MAG: 2,3-bisphosphoglycerate-independent phosphoglycerate mutase [Desulfobacterales bacterium]|nr:2,3-bisphosphoglycerate-independent phosphoglycerate mutase [Desulfobacterales bacterium]